MRVQAAYSVPQLHDDLGAARQPRGQLQDCHDRHSERRDGGWWLSKRGDGPGVTSFGFQRSTCDTPEGSSTVRLIPRTDKGAL